MTKVVRALLLAAFAGNAIAANINIGPNGCALADAIRAANTNSAVGNCAAGSGSDVIIAPDGWVVTLTSDLPTITSDMTIRSASPAGVFTISGNNDRRVLRITGNNTDVTLLRVDIVGGRTFGTGDGGAGIRIDNANVRLEDSFVFDNSSRSPATSGIEITDGELTLVRSAITDNRNGPGVTAVDSTVDVIESVFARNGSSDSGLYGGMRLIGSSLLVERSMFDEPTIHIVGSQSTAEIVNSTFDNRTPSDFSPGESLYFDGFSNVTFNHVTIKQEFTFIDSTISISNSLVRSCELSGTILALNASNLNFIVDGSFRNCLDDDPVQYDILPPAFNGGPTRTRAIGNPLSGAINAGDPIYCASVDQRGEARDAACDVGAYEATGFADVEVTTRVEPAPPYVSGQVITIFADIKNNGPGRATNVRFDVDPDQAFVNSADSPFCNAIPCVITSIEAGQTQVVPVQITLGSYFSSPFSIELSARTTATSTYSDANENDPLGNNFDTVSDAINQGADVSIQLNRLTNGPFFVGQTIQYQAIIENAGPQTATGTQLQFLPTSLGSVTFTSGCTSTAGLACNIANVVSGSSRTVTLQGVVTGGFFNATASTSAAQVDINPADNVDNWGNGGGVTTADISVSAALLTGDPYYSLDYLEFSITIANGSSPASNILVDFDFPGAEFINVSPCADFPCVIPALAANGQVVLTAQYFAPLAVPGVVDTLNFRVRATPGQQDTNPSNNEVTIIKGLAPVADIAAQLSLVSEPPFYSGQEIQYALRVPNGGANAATSVNVSMSPQNLTLLGAYGVLCPTVNCTISRLNAFDEENITLVYQINSEGAFNLTATANAAEFDGNTGNNTDSSNNGGSALEPPNSDRIYADDFE